MPLFGLLAMFCWARSAQGLASVRASVGSAVGSKKPTELSPPTGTAGGTAGGFVRKSHTFDGRRCTYMYSEPRIGVPPNRPPLLLVHPVGIGISSWLWEPFAEAWKSHPLGGSAVYAPDLLGCGASDRFGNPEEEEGGGVDGLNELPLSWVRQCEALLGEVVQRPAVVVTQGGIAPLGIQLAGRYPAPQIGPAAAPGAVAWGGGGFLAGALGRPRAKNERAGGSVAQLVMASPPQWENLCAALPSAKVEENLRRLRALPRWAYDVLSSRPAVRFFSDLFLFAKAVDGGGCGELWLNKACGEAQGDYSSRPAIWAFNAGLCEREDLSAPLARLPQPTLVVLGQQIGGSAASVIQRGEKFEQGMANANAAIVPGKNVIPWQDPYSFCDLVSGFVRDPTEP